MKKIICIILIFAGLSFSSSSFAQGLPVFPGAGGYGAYTRAAYGGSSKPEIIKVTNLNASGEGSLQAAVSAPMPRVVVFEVSGTIRLNSDLIIGDPYITIAGQTAPSPGIMIRGAGINIETHDVLIQHIRIRPGDAGDGPDPGNLDCIKMDNPNKIAHNVVIDHCTLNWSLDEIMSTWYPNNPADLNVTFINCIFAEALNRSIHPQGDHPMGPLVGPGSRKVSLISNFFGHNGWRNPRFAGSCGIAANNYNYNCEGRNVEIQMGGNRGKPGIVQEVSIVNNVYERGPVSGTVPPVHIFIELLKGARVYIDGNICSGYSRCARNDSEASVIVSSPPDWPTGFVARPADQVKEYVLANAGARPNDRDEVEKRIVNDARQGTGSLKNSVEEAGGWPNYPVNRRSLSIPANPHADSGNGYTNLEIWLHKYATEVERK